MLVVLASRGATCTNSRSRLWKLTFARSRVQRRCIAQEAQPLGNLTVFEKPRSTSFSKQRLERLSSLRLQQVGLHRWEPCPPGYRFEEPDIGGGAFTRVFLVRNERTGDLQAMKRVDRHKLSRHFSISEAEAEEMVEREFFNMKTTSHPHIIKLFEFFQDSRFSYFVMEAVNGGTLRQLLEGTLKREGVKQLSEGYVAEVLQQALYALNHLHRQLKIHKDVKLENLMLLSHEGPPHLVLIDLGVAETLVNPSTTGETTSAVPMPGGTPQTMAPEVLDCFMGTGHSFNEKCDIFSLGVTAYQLITGQPPYQVAYRGGGSRGPVDYDTTRLNMNEDQLVQLESVGCSSGAADLLRQMLELRPEHRPSAVDCLRNDWLVKNCDRRRLRRLRREGRHSLGGIHLSPDVEEAAGVELLQLERRRICLRVMDFSKKTKLQRAVAYHLVAFLPVGKSRKAAESFKRVNHDFSGEISYDQISQALIQVLEVDEATAHRTALAMDLNQTGSLDFQEFSAAVVSIRGERGNKLLDQLLDRMGIAKDRDLTIDEVHAAVKHAMRVPVDRSQALEWLRNVDTASCEEGTYVSQTHFRRLLGQDESKDLQDAALLEASGLPAYSELV